VETQFGSLDIFSKQCSNGGPECLSAADEDHTGEVGQSHGTSQYLSESAASGRLVRLGLSRGRGGRFACTSLIRRWSLERLTVVRYDDVNMDSDVSSISMSINNGLLTQLLSIQ
jgi:hypothetical protein